MANAVKSRSVYRYFEPADNFVRIMVCDPGSLDLRVHQGLNRAAYRRLVIETCMPEYKNRLESVIQEILPDDPLLAEDLLYHLCVEVNPALDIHTVRLRGEPSEASAQSHETETQDERSAPAGIDDFLVSLRKRARDLGRRLSRKVVGQDAAIEALVQAVEKAAAGLAAPERPMGSFLFLGRTGTGKTELGRTFAADMFGTSNFRGIVRIDCSEFALAHEYAKLIGAPPGYIGHEDGGQLTEAVLKNPECIVLFDEIEKAHPRMHNLLLQILEDGVLTDNKGRKVSFERTFIVLTSNAGASEMLAARNAIGFSKSETLGTNRLEDIAATALETTFSPEFLGRLDETIVFKELDINAARKIAQRQLSDLAHRARTRKVRVAFTPAVARWVAERGFSADYGAREVRRVIRRELESPLSRFLIELGGGTKQMIRARVKNDEPVFELE